MSDKNECNPWCSVNSVEEDEKKTIKLFIQMQDKCPHCGNKCLDGGKCWSCIGDGGINK